MGEEIGGFNSTYVNKMKKAAAVVTIFATATLLASCAEDPGDSAGNSAGNSAGGNSSSSPGSTMGGMTNATTGETTVSPTMGTTMGGTTMGGGTTMSGTTSEGTTMSSTAAETTGGTTSGGGTAMGGTLTGVQDIVSETDKESLVGRQVNLQDVEVRSSVGDNGFLIGSSGADQIFVVPSQSANVEQGQTAAIGGTLEKIPSVSEARQQFGVSETVAALLQSQVVYLNAEQIQ